MPTVSPLWMTSIRSHPRGHRESSRVQRMRRGGRGRLGLRKPKGDAEEGRCAGLQQNETRETLREKTGPREGLQLDGVKGPTS